MISKIYISKMMFNSQRYFKIYKLFGIITIFKEEVCFSEFLNKGCDINE